MISLASGSVDVPVSRRRTTKQRDTDTRSQRVYHCLTADMPQTKRNSMLISTHDYPSPTSHCAGFPIPIQLLATQNGVKEERTRSLVFIRAMSSNSLVSLGTYILMLRRVPRRCAGWMLEENITVSVFSFALPLNCAIPEGIIRANVHTDYSYSNIRLQQENS